MLHWFVYIENANARGIEKYDVLASETIKREVKKVIKECAGDKDRFAELLDSKLMYWFWSKCEWEIVISGWPEDRSGKFRELKIDVYDQLKMNWDVFVDYVWEHRKEI